MNQNLKARNFQTIGADLGHSASKLTYEARGGKVARHLYASIAAPAIKINNAEEAENAKRETVFVGGKPYFVGDTAEIQARGSISTGLTSEWLLSNEHKALLTHAMNLATQGNSDHFDGIALVLGLPVKEFASSRDALREQATEIFPTGTEVTVMPQPMGAYHSMMLGRNGAPVSDHVISDESWAVIDVGHYSTDIAVIVNGRWVEKGAGGGPGVYVAAQELIRHMADRGINLDLFEAEKALRTQRLKQYGQQIDFKDEGKRAIESITEQVIDIASQLIQVHAKHLDGILIAGGGAPLVMSHLSTRWPHVRMVQDQYESIHAPLSGHRFIISEGLFRFGKMKNLMNSFART